MKMFVWGHPQLDLRTFTILIGIVFLGVGCVGPTTRDLNASGGESGTAQMFTLENLNGQPVALGDLLKDHKAVLLNFWATWCPFCREEIPGLIALQKQYEGRGFTVLGVDIGESNKKVSAYVQKIGVNYPVVIDADEQVAEGYKVVGIPTSFLVGMDGKVLGVYHARSSELVEDIEKALK